MPSSCKATTHMIAFILGHLLPCCTEANVVLCSIAIANGKPIRCSIAQHNMLTVVQVVEGQISNGRFNSFELSSKQCFVAMLVWRKNYSSFAVDNLAPRYSRNWMLVAYT